MQSARLGTRVRHGERALDVESRCSRFADQNSERFRSAKRAWQTCFPVWLADQIALALVVTAASPLILRSMPGLTAQALGVLWMSLVAALSACHALTGLYPGCALTSALELRRLGISCVTTCLAVFTALVFVSRFSYWLAQPAIVAVVLVLCCMGLTITQWVFRKWARALLIRHSWWGNRAIIITDDARGMEIYEAFSSHAELGLRPMGIVADADKLCENSCHLGSIGDLPAIASKLGADFGIVALFHRTPDEKRISLDEISAVAPHLLLASEDADFGRRWYGELEVGRFTFRRTDDHLHTPGARFLKRTFDLVLALAIGTLLLPVMAAVFLLVKNSSRGPGLISLERFGRNGRPFQCWKFRTMDIDAEAQLQYHLASNAALKAEWDKNQKLKNDPRRIPILTFLRQTGLDELPQLWHVIRGEMSLVGPRPISAREIGLYGEQFPLFCRALPGMTGWWQVKGHNHTTFQQRVELDTFYIRNWSLWLDVWILARTIKVVVTRDGTW